MTAAIILSIYCGLIVLASLLGGLVPLLVRLTHRRLEIAISFVAGVILGIGFLHLLPHALAEMDADETTMGWVLAGFLVMFFLDRFFHFHHHDAPGAGPTAGEACDGHQHSSHVDPLHAGPQLQAKHEHFPHEAADAQHAEIAPRLSNAAFSWGGATVGLTMHSLIEGLALAAGVAAELHEGAATHWAGLGIFLAVVLHKPFDSLTVGTLMAANGSPARRRHVVNLLFALVVPCGVLLYLASAGPALGHGSRVLGPALAFAAGAFVCIASSDLLPELQFHSHDRGKLSAALLLGIALAAGIVQLERSSHTHVHSAGHEAQQSESHDSEPRSNDAGHHRHAH